ncbi:MAG: DUF975 family protein [Treponema sp.]|nr:DUF975 family protein [Treponema sp.]
MFDRAIYKARALEQLKNRWLVPCLVSAAVIVIYVGLSFASGLVADKSMGVLISQFISLLLICEAGIASMVVHYIHLKISRSAEPATFDDVLVAIGDYSVKGILGLLWYSLWVFLWSLLFYIPGIVKSIAYSQMFFVMIENPGIGPMKAMNISKVMTNGHKADLFVMELSFLGWGILCCLSGGIGLVWLIPYEMTAFSNAYTALKMEAINTGKLTPADFSK